MRIGINASFLRKPGTGIGQVSLNFLKTLAGDENGAKHEYFLYMEEDIDTSFLPNNFTKRVFLPFWKRDDLLRKWLWEKFTLPNKVVEDNIEGFVSLYQSTTVLPDHVSHTMVVHDLIPRFFPEYQSNMRLKFFWGDIEHAIRKATRIVAVSESTRNDLVEFGIERSKIVLAYPGVASVFGREVDEANMQRVLQKYSLKPGYLYHGGGLEVRKNAEMLLRAYAALIEKEKKGLLMYPLPPLIVTGKIFPKSNKLATCVEDLLEELKLEGRVRFLGFVPEEDLPALYKQSLFFIYPSLYEGFGLPVLEALSMHTPVLTGDISSLPEVAGDAALYIDPSSLDSLLSGMERLLTDSELRKLLSEKSSEQASKFSWTTFTKTLMQTIEHT